MPKRGNLHKISAKIRLDTLSGFTDRNENVFDVADLSRTNGGPKKAKMRRMFLLQNGAETTVSVIRDNNQKNFEGEAIYCCFLLVHIADPSKE